MVVMGMDGKTAYPGSGQTTDRERAVAFARGALDTSASHLSDDVRNLARQFLRALALPE